MVLVTNSKRLWLASMAVSLVIFAVIYLTVIQPSTNTANQLARQGQQAISTGIKQSQQAIKQAQQATGAGVGASSAASGTAASGAAANTAANKTLNKAAKLAACVTKAGADASAISACQVKFAN